MITFQIITKLCRPSHLVPAVNALPLWNLNVYVGGCRQFRSSTTVAEATLTEATLDHNQLDTYGQTESHALSYGRNIFADTALITIHAGSGGNGCISFLREKYFDNGPANGGDGGNGGSIYIQAIKGETSLHKLARRRVIKAGKGQHGKGKGKGGQRGEDVLLQVPVGTVVREVSRHDPLTSKEDQEVESDDHESQQEAVRGKWRRDKWLLHPGAKPADYATTVFPRLPKGRRSHLLARQPAAPIYLDLSQPMESPVLLATGAAGGCGNPHFLSSAMPKPKIATRGDKGISMTLEMELKLLADLGFVGMPNAGKSTLLRALSRSQARVGDWAFTTLAPNIGTMILDNSRGRPILQATDNDGEPRTSVSIADIPGLIADAHLDKGLGLGFLRHIERAKVLAFVVDLNAGDAVASLKSLWQELAAFERLQDSETNRQTERRMDEDPFDTMSRQTYTDQRSQDIFSPESRAWDESTPEPPISAKPWFVVANKADLDGTEANFQGLKAYLESVSKNEIDHPAGKKTMWQGPLTAIPVSAIRGEGVESIAQWTVHLLEN